HALIFLRKRARRPLRALFASEPAGEIPHWLRAKWEPGRVARRPCKPFLAFSPPKNSRKQPKTPRFRDFLPWQGSGAAPRVPQQRDESREKESHVNKNDLIQKLADHTGLPKNDAAKALDGA